MIRTHEKKEIERNKTFEFHKRNFSTICDTPEGIDAIKFIMQLCSYQKPAITFNPETLEVNKEATLFLEARRSVYLELRKYIREEYLKKIEYGKFNMEEDNG